MRALAHQLRFDLLSFRRNPAATFFTVALPLVFLVAFGSIFGGEFMQTRGVKVSQYYVPGILALSLISATTVNLAMNTVARRESGVLKRVRGTPLSPTVFLTSIVLAAVVITAVMTVLVLAIGWVAFDVKLNAGGVVNLIIVLVVSTVAFSLMGLALSTAIPSFEAAPAITNAVVLPLYFLSGTFFSIDTAPQWLRTVANIFPVRHLSEALFTSFDPMEQGIAFAGNHVLVVVAWGLGAALIARVRFRWAPWGS